MLCRLFAVSFLVASFGAPAMSQPASDPQKAKGSEERICETIVFTGSRIAARKYCGTRAEWADRRKQDREAVEKAQMGPCMQTHSSSSGRPSC